MTDGIGVLGTVFGLVGFLFAILGAVLAVSVVRRAVQRGRVLSSGLTAEARCLDSYVKRDAEGASRRRVILGFTTADGRQIRFEDAPRGPVVIGDQVLVRYLPERPERAVTVGGSATGIAVQTVLALVCAGLFVVVGLAFGLGGLGVGLFGFGGFGSPAGP